MKKLSKILATTIFFVYLFSFKQVGYAGEFESGVSAYQDGDIVQAYTHWKKEAEVGSSVAQFNLGVLFETGSGVEQDFKKSFKWFQRAALNDHAMSQLKMGFLNYEDKYNIKNFTEAARWFHLAAAQNNPRAMYRLSMMYTMGKGVEQNSSSAVELYNRSLDFICSMGVGLESSVMVPILKALERS
jgi:hypothetical protein